MRVAVHAGERRLHARGQRDIAENKNRTAVFGGAPPIDRSAVQRLPVCRGFLDCIGRQPFPD